MKTCADDVRAAWPLFQAARSGANPTSALSLRLVKIDLQRALELNRLWHSRLPRMGVGAVKTMPFLCFAAEFDGIYYAVAIWSNPVARDLEVLVSYQDMESHTGTIYKAAGWLPTSMNKDGNWTRPKRQRPKAQSMAAKQRWEKVLRCPKPATD